MRRLLALFTLFSMQTCGQIWEKLMKFHSRGISSLLLLSFPPLNVRIGIGNIVRFICRSWFLEYSLRNVTKSWSLLAFEVILFSWKLDPWALK